MYGLARLDPWVIRLNLNVKPMYTLPTGCTHILKDALFDCWSFLDDVTILVNLTQPVCARPLIHSKAELYLFGAVVTSWVQPQGSDVLYVRPDVKFDGVKPIS